MQIGCPGYPRHGLAQDFFKVPIPLTQNRENLVENG